MSINCIRCEAVVETDCPDLMKYCDDCYRDIQHELSQPHTPERADQSSEIDLLSRDITHEILFNTRRRDNYVYPIKPARLRARRAEYWMEDYLDVELPDLCDHDREADNHINRVRGRNC